MKPTAPELLILKALWSQSPLSAREIHDIVLPELDWSYSSTRKTLDRMLEKGFIDVLSEGNKNTYHVKVDKVATLAKFVQDLAQRVFELDGPLPVAMFTDSRLIEDHEIDDLEKLLNDLAKKDH